MKKIFSLLLLICLTISTMAVIVAHADEDSGGSTVQTIINTIKTRSTPSVNPNAGGAVRG